MKTKVLQALKPKAASLGFTKEELESVVDSISGTLQEDATEDQINAQVDAVIPFLKLSQSAATRIVNASKEKKTKETEASPEASKVSDNPEEDKFDKLLKVIEAQNAKIDSLVSKDVKTSRRSVYVAKLKELPDEIQKTKLKDFDRMSFTDQDDFETFISEVEADVPVILQGLSNQGLSDMGKPIKGGATSKEASDKEVTEIINKMDL